MPKSTERTTIDWPDTLYYPKIIRWAGRSFHRLSKRSRYYAATFNIRGRAKSLTLHRLVWEAFNGKKIPTHHEIHHIDGNRLNNHPSNLREILPHKHKKLHLKIRKEKSPGWWKRGLKKAQAKAKRWHGSAPGIKWHRKHGLETWDCREKIDKKCLECKRTFSTYWPKRGVYCSKRCSQKAWWRRNPFRKERYNENRNLKRRLTKPHYEER